MLQLSFRHSGMKRGLRTTVLLLLPALLAPIICGAAGEQVGCAPGEAGAVEKVEKEPAWMKHWRKLPEELRALLEKVDEAGRRLTDVRADVDYSREIPLLEHEERAAGSLVFKKPDKIVLKLGEPRNEDVYTDGELWWVVDHEDKQVEIYKAEKSELVSREAVFLRFGIGESTRSLLPEYKVDLKGKRVEERKEKNAETGEETTRRIIWYRLSFHRGRDTRRPVAASRHRSARAGGRDNPHLPPVQAQT